MRENYFNGTSRVSEEDYIREVTLERMHFAIQRVIVGYDLEKIDYDLEYEGRLGVDMYIRMHTHIYGEPGKAYEEIIEYPSDWWQGLKERWFSKWLKERYPVKKERRVVSVKTLYPNIKPPEIDHYRYPNEYVLQVERSKVNV